MNEDLEASSVLAWILLNKFVTENQKPLEFGDHRFMIDPLSDPCDDIVGKKSAQVGWSVGEIMHSFHSAKYEKRNIGYILPTRSVVDDFVKPKVNPLIQSNKAISDMTSDDSISIKKIGDRFIYFKGAFSQTAAISFSVDTLVLDEYDRMPDMNVVNTFDSRLQAAEHPKRRRFSNPSGINFGVDALYNDSDQRHWFVRCHRCNHYWFMDLEKTSDKNHYINRDKGFYACGKCDLELSDSDRRNGEWVARFPSRPRHGYWFSQMMAPWVTAKRILDQESESSIEFFYNFVLGKAYTPSDMIVDRMAILRATAPSTIAKTGVAMGVDQDAGGCYYVLMTAQGVFAHGYVDSWEKIEHLKLTYQAVVVCDPNPYPTMPKIMAEKYSDWYMCYFKTMEGVDTIRWDGSKVLADRTRVIDIVANEIINAKLLFRQRPHELEPMIAHWNNLYRITDTKDDGRSKSTWIKKDDKQSDYPFALTYARIALSKVMGSGSQLIEQTIQRETVETNVVNNNGMLETDFSGILEETMENME
jgi:hypothetical protein